MKKFNILFILLILSTNVLAKIELYTRDSKDPHEVSEMYDLLKSMIEKYPEKNLVYYVHGRSKDVEGEWKKIPKMEDYYNVKVIMLHWDSYSTLLSRPVKNAELTSHELQKTFEDVKKIRLDYPDFFENRSLNLLCHSMGNLVLKHNVEFYHYDQQDQFILFDNFVSVGADVPMNDHYIWLEHLNFVKEKYITMNNRDIVLLLSYLLDLKVKHPFTYKLGLGFDNYPSKKQNIKSKVLDNINYLDLSDVLVSDHAYNVSKDKIMINIFNKLLNGQSFISPNKDENNFKIKTDKEKKNIYYISK